jgi:hypothetical protein
LGIVSLFWKSANVVSDENVHRKKEAENEGQSG